MAPQLRRRSLPASVKMSGCYMIVARRDAAQPMLERRVRRLWLYRLQLALSYLVAVWLVGLLASNVNVLLVLPCLLIMVAAAGVGAFAVMKTDDDVSVIFEANPFGPMREVADTMRRAVAMERTGHIAAGTVDQLVGELRSKLMPGDDAAHLNEAVELLKYLIYQARKDVCDRRL